MLYDLMRSAEEFTRHRYEYAKRHNHPDTDQLEAVWKTTKRYFEMVSKIENGEAYKWGDL